jgi:hypothetical protein
VSLVVALLVLLPPVVLLLDGRRPRAVLGALLVADLVCFVAWFLAWDADMDHADATGGAGSILAGWGWIVGGCVAAVAAMVVGRRPQVRTDR